MHNDIAEEIMGKRVKIENEEVIKFLQKHNLPVDKEKLEEKGYKVLITYHTNETMTKGIETIDFELVKIVDKQQLKVNYNISII